MSSSGPGEPRLNPPASSGARKGLDIPPKPYKMWAMIVLCVLAGLSLVSMWAVSFLLIKRVELIEARTKTQLTETFRAIVEPATEGQPSVLAVYSDQVATLFAARIIQQLKTAAGGIASGVSKEAEAGALGQLAGGSPWVALLAGLLPKRFRSQLLSAPQFASQLRLPEPSDNGHRSTATVADRLKRQG